MKIKKLDWKQSPHKRPAWYAYIDDNHMISYYMYEKANGKIEFNLEFEREDFSGNTVNTILEYFDNVKSFDEAKAVCQKHFNEWIMSWVENCSCVMTPDEQILTEVYHG